MFTTPAPSGVYFVRARAVNAFASRAATNDVQVVLIYARRGGLVAALISPILDVRHLLRPKRPRRSTSAVN